MASAASLRAIVTGYLRTVTTGSAGAVTVSAGVIDDCVSEALADHSRRSPRRVTADISGDGETHEYVLVTVASDWTAGLSVVQRVRTIPDGAEDGYMYWMESDRWHVLRDGTSDVIVFETPIASGDTARLYYTAPWPAATWPSEDDYAIANLAASKATEIIAQFFAQEGAPTLDVAFAQNSPKVDAYLQTARRFADRYLSHFGYKDLKSRRPFSTVLDWDTASWRGRPWIDPRHNRRWR